MPIPNQMMPDTKLEHDDYVEWVLLRATKFYAMRMGAGVRGRERHDCRSLREAVETADRLARDTGRPLLVYGSWDGDLRCELVSQKLRAAALNGTFVPYIERPEGAPEGTWLPEEDGGTWAEAAWLAEQDALEMANRDE